MVLMLQAEWIGWTEATTGAETTTTAGIANHSPILGTAPHGLQNDVGENFDFAFTEGVLTGGGSGFGTWGEIILNYDATYLYIGGRALDVAGDTNVAVLFIDVDTLTDDKRNLWANSGNPKALDFLHNVTFTHPMDLALVIGDEYGDGHYPAFQLQSGDEMGQGVFHLSQSTFNPVAGALLTQFDGLEDSPTLSEDDDGNARTHRWEAAIPWASLNATGIADLSSLRIAGVMISSSHNENNSYLSGQILADNQGEHPPLDAFENYGYQSLSLTGHPLTLPRFLAPQPIAGSSLISEEGFKLRWSADPWHHYRVYRSLDLKTFTLYAAGIPAQTTENLWIDSSLPSDRAFYTVQSKSPNEPLRLMSFNIRYGSADDGANSWEHRRDQVGRLITREPPHLIGVQEAERFQLDELITRINGYAEIGEGRSGGIWGEYSPILYRVDRLQVIDSGTFWLSDTPEVTGSTTWGNALPRICTWAQFRDLKTGQCFYHFNTHLDHANQYARERSIRLITQRISSRADNSCAYLLTGDFNASEDNIVIQYARSLGQIDNATATSDGASMTDVFRQRHPSATNVGTIHGFSENKDSVNRIDYIFLSPQWKHSDARTLHDNENGSYPSDHFPITAELLLFN